MTSLTWRATLHLVDPPDSCWGTFSSLSIPKPNRLGVAQVYKQVWKGLKFTDLRKSSDRQQFQCIQIRLLSRLGSRATPRLSVSLETHMEWRRCKCYLKAHSNDEGWTTRARELRLWRKLLNFFLHPWGTVEHTREFVFKENVGISSSNQNAKNNANSVY